MKKKSIEQWNKDLPGGTPVKYYPIKGEPEFIEAVTRSEVWDLCGNPVVLIEGKSGGVSCLHLEVKESK